MQSIETQTYSFLKGLRTTVLGIIAMALGFYIVANPAFADINVGTFIAQHIQATLGTLTIGGAINLLLDYIHQKSS